MSKEMVRTHVPQYQKQEWLDHKEQTNPGMSQSQWVCMMIEAGRRALSPEIVKEQSDDTDDTEEPNDNLPDDPDDRLEECVILTLNDGDYYSWAELLTRFGYNREDLSAELDDTLKQLMNDGEVQYDPRNGYTLATA